MARRLRLPRQPSWTVRRLCLGALLAAAALSSRGAGAATGAAADAAPVRVLVRFAPGVDAGDRERLSARLDGRIRRQLRGAPIAAFEVPAAELDALRSDPRVMEVEPDPIYHAAALSLSELTPTLDNGLYGLVLTRAVAAQARKVTGKGVRVCIADTGIDAHHPDLVAAYRGGFDLVDGDENPDIGSDPGLGEHGTMVAGVIAAAINRKGVHGVAPDAQIVHARVLGADGTGRGSDIMAAVERLVEQEGCRVVNLSLGTKTRTDIEESFYRDLLAHNDVLIVAASGNDSQVGVIYPAAYPGVAAVGAVGRDEQLATFSNTGPELALVAPGVGVLSSVPRGSGSESYVAAGRTLAANSFFYAGQTTRKGIAGVLVDCGYGNTPEDFPRTVRGNLALIHRDGIVFFSDKVLNAMNAGARGVVIYNNIVDAGLGSLQTATTSDGRAWIPAVFVSRDDGAFLLTRKRITLVSSPSDWDAANGTSFAAPHVSGVAALVLSVNPSLSSAQVLDLLERTAVDLGDPGLDPSFGWGLVDADAATRAAAGN